MMVGGTDTRYPNLLKCLNESSFWCSCPYTHLNVSTLGKYRSCCSATDLEYSIFDADISQHFNSKSMFKLRKEFESDIDMGMKQNHCAKCLELESKRVTSKRQRFNFKLLKDIRNNENLDYLDSLEKLITTSLRNEPIDISQIVFRSVELEFFGNLCNLSCMMCKSEKSSIFKQDIVNPYLQIREKTSFMDELFRCIHQSPVLKFTGGELSINKSFLEFVEQLSNESCASRQKFEFVTNGMIFPDAMMPHLQKFNNACVCVSVDGYGIINELQRRGSKFSVVDKSIDKYKTHLGKENVLLLSAITPLNCSRVDELYLYSKNKDVAINMSCAVMLPREYCISILPDELRQKYLDKLSKSPHKFAFSSTLQFLQYGKYDEFYFRKYMNDITFTYPPELILKYYPEYRSYMETL